MSLLYDARRLLTLDLGLCYGDAHGADARCGGCGTPEGGEHLGRCPWIAGPKIIAALEAVEQLVQEDAHTNDYAVSYQGQMACNSCDAITSSIQWTDKEGRAFPQPHTPACRWQRVVTALKGDA